jgi:hypothetical protein
MRRKKENCFTLFALTYFNKTEKNKLILAKVWAALHRWMGGVVRYRIFISPHRQLTPNGLITQANYWHNGIINVCYHSTPYNKELSAADATINDFEIETLLS